MARKIAEALLWLLVFGHLPNENWEANKRWKAKTVTKNEKDFGPAQIYWKLASVAEQSNA